MLIAETAMPAAGRRATGDAFRVLARYIFGENEPGRKMAMTAPVLMGDGAASRKIAMTAPVPVRDGGAGAAMAFVMPSGFSRATLPRPKDDRVTIREVPARTMAALGFS